MINDFANTCYKAVINCFFFEFTIDSRTCNPHFLYDTRNGNTAVFDGFLQDFALMWHMECIA